MRDRALKENRKHKEKGLPVSCYRVGSPYENYFQLECHWHDEMELFKVGRGTVQVQCGKDCFEAQRGDIVFFNSRELHAAKALDRKEMEFVAVVFSPEVLCGEESDLCRIKYVAPVMDGRLQVRRIIPREEKGFQKLFEETVELLEGKEPAYELRVRAKLLELFSCLVENGETRAEERERASSGAVKEAIDYIHLNYRRQISIGELSRLCHMSDGHFCRMFKRYTFKTPVQYINGVRLSAAMELLSRTDRKVLDIAMDTGFNSLSYFIGVFKENLGCTPTQFRKPPEGPEKGAPGRIEGRGGKL